MDVTLAWPQLLLPGFSGGCGWGHTFYNAGPLHKNGWHSATVPWYFLILIMACTTYRFPTWNVNGLYAQFNDLHSYVITHKPIIALQEVEPEVPQLTTSQVAS